MTHDIFTVGHSNLSYTEFLELIGGAGVTALADVRSAPVSRFAPHFDERPLKVALRSDGIGYAFLGRELGGRPADPSLYRAGRADYEAMARSDVFRQGLRRVTEGARRHRIALMCSEHDPVDCHRCLLVGRALADDGVKVRHLMKSGEEASQTDVERRLLSMNGDDGRQNDLLFSDRERLIEAYRAQAARVAFDAQRAAPRTSAA